MAQQAKIPREKIEQLEALLLTQPSTLHPAEHDFVDGVYARTMRLDANTIATGGIHRNESFLVVRLGHGILGTPDGLKWFNAGDVFKHKPGAKNFVYVIEDAVLTTFHPNADNETNPEELWERYICPAGELEHEIKLQIEAQ